MKLRRKGSKIRRKYAECYSSIKLTADSVHLIKEPLLQNLLWYLNVIILFLSDIPLATAELSLGRNASEMAI